MFISLPAMFRRVMEVADNASFFFIAKKLNYCSLKLYILNQIYPPHPLINTH
jgi:hypothetical protein